MSVCLSVFKSVYLAVGTKTGGRIDVKFGNEGYCYPRMCMG